MNQPGMKAPTGWQTARADKDQPDDNLLQVIICYGWVTSNHACLRLQGPVGSVLFWDPGGMFGEAVVPNHRHNDLLLEAYAPSLAQIWDYRRVGCNEPMMLVFEWRLTDAQAQANRKLILAGERGFESDAPGGFCSVYVSRFLQRYCQPALGLERGWFWPHNLARRLWRAGPDRVWLFRRHKPVQLYQQQVHDHRS
jgi:hypothetical protein